MEFATKHSGTRLIVIMGHTQCGAIAGACAGVDHPAELKGLLSLLKPAVAQVQKHYHHALNCSDPKIVDEIARQNVIDQLHHTVKESPALADKVKDGDIMLVGAMHDISTGKVNFFDMNGRPI